MRHANSRRFGDSVYRIAIGGRCAIGSGVVLVRLDMSLMRVDNSEKRTRPVNNNPPTSKIASSTPNRGPASEQSADSAGLEPGRRPPTPAELHALNTALAQEFPVPVDLTELVLMDVDPTRLHAFWSVMPFDLGAVEQTFDPTDMASTMVLRLHDVTPARFGHVDRVRPIEIDVEGLQGNRYIDDLEPGRSYVAELGLVRPDGAFVAVTESNTLLMPGVAPPLARSTPIAVAEKRFELPATRPQEVRPVRMPDLEPVFPNAGDAEPWGSLTLLPGGLPTGARAARDPGTGAGYPTSVGSTATRPADFTGDPGSPAWSGVAPGLGSWSSFGRYSSSDLARPDTDLELTVELLVRGRTRPGGTLSLFGRPVSLGPDGSFSVRQRLPDEVIPLALVLGRDTTANDGGS